LDIFDIRGVSIVGSEIAPQTPDSGQAAKRKPLWVSDQSGSHFGIHCPLIRHPLRSLPSGLTARRERMITSDPIAKDAIDEVAALLAAAYRRYLAANRLPDAPETPHEAVNGELDNGHVKSPHAQ
jgi:hypothetical protein